MTCKEWLLLSFVWWDVKLAVPGPVCVLVELQWVQVCHTSPYLVPDISCRDVLHQNFEGYKPEVQELICVADRLGSLMQYETPGFLPNKRIHRGILEI